MLEVQHFSLFPSLADGDCYIASSTCILMVFKKIFCMHTHMVITGKKAENPSMQTNGLISCTVLPINVMSVAFRPDTINGA